MLHDFGRDELSNLIKFRQFRFQTMTSVVRLNHPGRKPWA